MPSAPIFEARLKRRAVVKGGPGGRGVLHGGLVGTSCTLAVASLGSMNAKTPTTPSMRKERAAERTASTHERATTARKRKSCDRSRFSLTHGADLEQTSDLARDLARGLGEVTRGLAEASRGLAEASRGHTRPRKGSARPRETLRGAREASRAASRVACGVARGVARAFHARGTRISRTVPRA